MHLTKFQKLRILHTKGRDLSVVDKLRRSYTQKELLLIELKHKPLPPQLRFAMSHDNQFKLVHCLVKHETVLLTQKEDCHPILVDFGNDQF